MTDPYKVLGISPNASEEEVKAAYKALAKKYHPDNYANNPLSDLASEKMQEINEAYDTIIKNLRNGGGYAGANAGGYGGGASASSQFADIRRMVQQGRVIEAEELLDGVPQGQRDAEWNFLKGSVLYARGWLDDALQYINAACRMNPNNPEYRAALNQMMYKRGGGMNGGYNPQMGGAGGAGGCSSCDLCAGLCCADSCCECMGGDLCTCC